MAYPRGITPRALLFPAVLASAFALVWVFRGPLFSIFASAESIRAAVRSTGPWAPAAFILLQLLQVVVFFIPGEIVQISGGWLFGAVGGSVLSVIGIALGSLAAYGLSRRLGTDFVSALFGLDRTARLGELARSPRGMTVLFLLFAIPGIPKDLLCFIAGLAALRMGSFLAVSLAARLPGIIASSVMGAAVHAGHRGVLFSLLGAAVLLFILGTLFRARIYSFLMSIATPGKGR